MMKSGIQSKTIGTPIKSGLLGQSIYLKWSLFMFMIYSSKVLRYNLLTI